MSRWLKSVNNLLENLDGTAETVVEQGVTASGQLLGNRRPVVTDSTTAGLIGRATSTLSITNNEDEEEEAEESFDSSADEEYEEDITDDDDGPVIEATNETTTLQDQHYSEDVDHESSPIASVPQTQDHDAAVFGRRRGDSVSDVTFSEALDDETAVAAEETHPFETIETTAITVKDQIPDPKTLCSAPSITKATSPSSNNSQSEEEISETQQKLDSHTTGNTPEDDVATQQESKIVSTNRTMENEKQSLANKVEKQKVTETLSKSTSTLKTPILTNQPVDTVLTKLEDQLQKLRGELETLQQQNRSLQQTVTSLESIITNNEQEIEAQGRELQQAAKEMEKIRKEAKDEQDEILDDHDEEIEDLQKEHQAELNKMRNEYESMIANWKDQFENEQLKRQEEGGNWNQELEDAIQREKDALKRLHIVTIEKEELQSKHTSMKNCIDDMQKKLDSAVIATEAAVERERQANDELDNAKALYANQLLQRQHREGELEQTIAQLGSALSLAKQEAQRRLPSQSAGQESQSDPLQDIECSKTEGRAQDCVRCRDLLEQTREEVENLEVQLRLETQRRVAFEEELQEITMERTQELAMEKSRQQQSDNKIADLQMTVSRLQASLLQASELSFDGTAPSTQHISDPGTDTESPVSNELGEAKREITRLSEQLLRQQRLAETAKSEVLALKGRLQAATARAEQAEMAQKQVETTHGSGSLAYDNMESGRSGKMSAMPNFTTRRRIKGRGNGGSAGRAGVRSIRSALRWGNASVRTDESFGFAEQIVMTIDGIDSWMVDTGSFMKAEPLARLGFLLYLLTLHIWTFALVVFHTTEVQHGDFGSMDSNPRHWKEHHVP